MIVMIMNVFLRILIFLTITVLPQEAIELLYKNGNPTPKGIDKYVENYCDSFILEFQRYIKDSIYYDIFMTTTDLSKLADYDENELGRTEIYPSGCDIIITNQKYKFSDYSINTLTKRGGVKYRDEYQEFVKSVMFHELMHVYFRQEMYKLYKQDSLNHYYYNVQLMPNIEMRYGSIFIEEGLCEYLIRSKGEIMDVKNRYVPKTIADINNKENKFLIQYQYSSYYLKNFMDSCTVKYGRMRPAIEILLRNQPPSYNEILNPKQYFDRLK